MAGPSKCPHNCPFGPHFIAWKRLHFLSAEYFDNWHNLTARKCPLSCPIFFCKDWLPFAFLGWQALVGARSAVPCAGTFLLENWLLSFRPNLSTIARWSVPAQRSFVLAHFCLKTDFFRFGRIFRRLPEGQCPLSFPFCSYFTVGMLTPLDWIFRRLTGSKCPLCCPKLFLDELTSFCRS